MGQVGLHALTGLAVGEHFLTPYVHDRAGRRALMFGFVMGNIVPDLDFLAVIGMFPLDHTVALHLHRTFSHSIVAALGIGLGFYLASLLMQDTYFRYIGLGIALGTVAHFTEDIFLWFVPVDIFWPASVFGIIPPVNLWWWYETPVLASRLMGAAEFAAFALYYEHLIRLARGFQTDLEFVPMVQRLAWSCWVSWALLTSLALDTPPATFDIYLYVPLGIVFMPACLYTTWRMQTTIEFVGLLERTKKERA